MSSFAKMFVLIFSSKNIFLLCYFLLWHIVFVCLIDIIWNSQYQNMKIFEKFFEKFLQMNSSYDSYFLYTRDTSVFGCFS